MYEEERVPFKITQLKIEHFHFSDGEIDIGMPKKTSIELKSKYNYETDKLEWKKIVTHTYLKLDSDKETDTSSYTETIKNPDELIKKIEKYDLRDLGNNYFTEKTPERFSHWELIYNNRFKIVGTYDQRVNEFEKISELLQFKKIIEEEVNKVREMVDNIQ